MAPAHYGNEGTKNLPQCLQMLFDFALLRVVVQMEVSRGIHVLLIAELPGYGYSNKAIYEEGQVVSARLAPSRTFVLNITSGASRVSVKMSICKRLNHSGPRGEEPYVTATV